MKTIVRNLCVIFLVFSVSSLTVSAQSHRIDRLASPLERLGKVTPSLRVVDDNISTYSVVSSVDANVAFEKKSITGVYIVQLTDPSVASYRGGILDLAPSNTGSHPAGEIDFKSQASQAYVSYLDTRQEDLISSIESDFNHPLEVLYTYRYAFNGLAVELSPEEAVFVKNMQGVKLVQPERLEQPQTDSGPSFIGAPGLWDGSSTYNGIGTKGEGVVVGIIDTGINFDHPSFADLGGDSYNHSNPKGGGNYVGVCNPEEPSYNSALVCNDKLIGAWSFVKSQDPPSPEDSDGHGSHTASTVAGNRVNATLIAPTLSLTKSISGVAPHANIIAYDACYNAGCPNSAVLAAVDQAVLDGVDVINYSISGGEDPYQDAVELAFLDAFDAGVFVSASAGNSGPGAATVAHRSPWVMTVAASTHNRAYPNHLTSLTGGNTSPPAAMLGKGFTSGYGPAQIVYAAGYGDALCAPSAFSPGIFDGKIVVCDRGVHARIDKAQSVMHGGAGGFVLANDSANGNSLTGDAFALPGVHITYDAGVALKTWLASGSNHMATITGIDESLLGSNGDVMAGFSSRGPNTAFDILKPDITAPGVDIWAAVSTTDPAGPAEYGFLSGTSMSSPHNAGAAVLMKALFPSWSPAEIKSALMMTSSNGFFYKEDGVTNSDPFDLGAGRVDLRVAALTGLVLNETKINFSAADPALDGDPRTLNIASMVDSHCSKTCSWTRTVRSALTSTQQWEAVLLLPKGMTGAVTPAFFTLSPGAAQSIQVNLNVNNLAGEKWAFAELKMLPKGTNNQVSPAHIPIATYIINSTDINTIRKSADVETIAVGGALHYTMTVQNSTAISRTLTLTDKVPLNTTYLPGSATNGLEYDSSTKTLSWTGHLNPSGLFVDETVKFGYVSLASLGATPFDVPSNADDGGWIISYLDFYYLGSHYTSVIWSVNGTLEAGNASGIASAGMNIHLPDATIPNNLLAPWWADLDLGAGGNWYWVTLTDDGGNNYDVFEWEDIPRYGDATSRATFQVWIEKGTSNIWFSYGPYSGSVTPATVGIENSSGDVGDTYYYNGAGTMPSSDKDLLVNHQDGGPVVLSFMATVSGKPGTFIINEAEVSDGTITHQAWAPVLLREEVFFIPLIRK